MDLLASFIFAFKFKQSTFEHPFTIKA